MRMGLSRTRRFALLVVSGWMMTALPAGAQDEYHFEWGLPFIPVTVGYSTADGFFASVDGEIRTPIGTFGGGVEAHLPDTEGTVLRIVMPDGRTEVYALGHGKFEVRLPKMMEGAVIRKDDNGDINVLIDQEPLVQRTYGQRTYGSPPIRKRERPNPNVVRCPRSGNWCPATGYRWANDDPGDYRVVWNPGEEHPSYDHVIAAVRETKWIPAPGYRWAGGSSDYRVVWSPGKPHPRHPSVVASTRRGRWVPAPGYRWVDEHADGDRRVVWDPGTPHPRHAHVVASPTKGIWKPQPGYRWLNRLPDDFRVTPL